MYPKSTRVHVRRQCVQCALTLNCSCVTAFGSCTSIAVVNMPFGTGVASCLARMCRIRGISRRLQYGCVCRSKASVFCARTRTYNNRIHTWCVCARAHANTNRTIQACRECKQIVHDSFMCFSEHCYRHVHTTLLQQMTHIVKYCDACWHAPGTQASLVRWLWRRAFRDYRVSCRPQTDVTCSSFDVFD